MSILIKNVIDYLSGGRKIDVYIEEDKISKIGSSLNFRADYKIDGKSQKAILPGFFNMHCHSAMILMRGWADDMPLDKWLQEKIWPLEQKIDEEDVYWGTKLASLEMIKSGTIGFNDMYWYPEAAAVAVKEVGIKAVIGLPLIDFDVRGSKENVQKNFLKLKGLDVQLAVAPHAIYTVCTENLIWAQKFATAHRLRLHLHISETKKEIDFCRQKYNLSPIEYLDKLKLLSRKSILAHSVWLSDKEIKILKKRKPNLVYNPVSNMKLAVGSVFPYLKLKDKVNVCLGTDGPTSNNSLNMLETMKIAALLQKHANYNPGVAPATEVMKWASKNANIALSGKWGEIKEKNEANMVLVDLNHISFIPNHNFISNLVYSAQSESISDVICQGKIVMQDRIIEDENKIYKKALARAKNLVSKYEKIQPSKN